MAQLADDLVKVRYTVVHHYPERRPLLPFGVRPLPDALADLAVNESSLGVGSEAVRLEHGSSSMVPVDAQDDAKAGEARSSSR